MITQEQFREHLPLQGEQIDIDWNTVTGLDIEAFDANTLFQSFWSDHPYAISYGGVWEQQTALLLDEAGVLVGKVNPGHYDLDLAEQLTRYSKDEFEEIEYDPEPEEYLVGGELVGAAMLRLKRLHEGLRMQRAPSDSDCENQNQEGNPDTVSYLLVVSKGQKLAAEVQEEQEEVVGRRKPVNFQRYLEVTLYKTPGGQHKTPNEYLQLALQVADSRPS